MCFETLSLWLTCKQCLISHYNEICSYSYSVHSGDPGPAAEGWSSDYISDYSGTGETAADWTGTGDSGVGLRHPQPLPPIPPKHTGPRYEKIRLDKLNKEHEYSRVKNWTDKSLTYPLPSMLRSLATSRGDGHTLPPGGTLKQLAGPPGGDSEPASQETVKHYENIHK